MRRRRRRACGATLPGCPATRRGARWGPAAPPTASSYHGPTMRITEMLARRRPVFSFEFFPPHTPQGTDSLFRTIAALRELEPSFVSVTCRNHSRAQTLELVSRIRTEVGIEPMAHYTCAGATREELHGMLQGLCAAGIENVLALRGDPTGDAQSFAPVDGGFHYGSELAAMIRSEYDLCIGGACYPEGHPESPSLEEELRATVTKVDSGVQVLIT